MHTSQDVFEFTCQFFCLHCDQPTFALGLRMQRAITLASSCGSFVINCISVVINSNTIIAPKSKRHELNCNAKSRRPNSIARVEMFPIEERPELTDCLRCDAPVLSYFYCPGRPSNLDESNAPPQFLSTIKMTRTEDPSRNWLQSFVRIKKGCLLSGYRSRACSRD